MHKWNDENTSQGFGGFLEWEVHAFVSRAQSAERHFRHAGLIINKF
jgi:hypothetical protein